MTFRQESAHTLGLQALAWIAARDEMFGAFLAAAGTDAGTLRTRAADPEVLGAVLDFLLADEAALIEFCLEAGVPPDHPMQARQALPGGDIPHWT